MSRPSNDHGRRVVASALWAAYADALGFITELADEARVQRRVGRLPVEPTSWARRVGGRTGPRADLPAGCYSDDTQLRLAVGRCINHDGFDVEAFARIELPVWLSYALGGGVATKKAATAMAKANADWYANFYPGWHESGGNGAAMRVQPHIWASQEPEVPGRADAEVLFDAITTHGHPRGMFGAVLHGRALAFALSTGHAPPANEWPLLVDQAAGVLDDVVGHPTLATVWAPKWNVTSREHLQEAWAQTARECVDMLKMASDIGPDQEPTARYQHLIERLGLEDPSRRGTGTVSVVAALALASWFDGDPETVSRISAHALGTDTDTIGTMAAAVAGAGATELPASSTVQDAEYIQAEATRLAAIAVGGHPPRFAYPDLLEWRPPKTQSDAYGVADGREALAGIGWCEPTGGGHWDVGQNRWSWVQTQFGQSLLVKQRLEPTVLPPAMWPVEWTQGDGEAPMTQTADRGELSALLSIHDVTAADAPQRGSVDEVVAANTPPGAADGAEEHTEPSASPAPTVRSGQLEDIQLMLAWVERSGYADASIGYAVRRLSEVTSMERLVSFVLLLRERMEMTRTTPPPSLPSAPPEDQAEGITAEGTGSAHKRR